jgi:PPK2 family polyphosphate:nucleotide phosphotransferase
MKANDFVIDPAGKLELDKLDPAATPGFDDKASAAAMLRQDIDELVSLQDRFKAQSRHGLLVVLQGMDAAGKDGVVKHVMSGVNPAGVSVYSFGPPSDEERRHDYLWRAAKRFPERGRMAIFNRSYYEDTLVTRVHPELLGGDAPEAGSNAFWERRFRDINNVERYLADNRIVVLKFFLHVSREEQKKRLLKRIDDPSKQWKFSVADLRERGFWPQYRHAYEETLRHTSTAWSPWHVIPADRKWFARVCVAHILVETLRELHPEYPPLSPEMQREVQRAGRLLRREEPA